MITPERRMEIKRTLKEVSNKRKVPQPFKNQNIQQQSSVQQTQPKYKSCCGSKKKYSK